MNHKQSLKWLPVDRLVAHDRNRVLNQDRVDDIANSIGKVGQLVPLIVTEHLTDYNRYLVLDGHHRQAALQQLGMSQVLCVVRHGLDEDTDGQLIVMLIGNAQRHEMSAMDRAELLGVLRRGGMTIEQIAERSGFSPSWVSESLALLELDSETRDRVRAGEVGVGQAKQAVRKVRGARRTARALGRPATGTPTVIVEAAHFTAKHPLADQVRHACDHTDASEGRVRPTVGGLGCGQCWEKAIRDDEDRRLATPQGEST